MECFGRVKLEKEAENRKIPEVKAVLHSVHRAEEKGTKLLLRGLDE